jgi:hypothetical protein
MDPKDRYKHLLFLLIQEISKIDKDTPHTFSEPSWWLSMSNLETIAINKMRELNSKDNG